jgi:hypothetical protein
MLSQYHFGHRCAPEQPVAVICCSRGTPLAARSTRVPSVTKSTAPEMPTMQPCCRASCLPASSASAAGQGRGQGRGQVDVRAAKSLQDGVPQQQTGRQTGHTGHKADRAGHPSPVAAGSQRRAAPRSALPRAPVGAAVLSTPLVAAPAAPASAMISEALPRTTVGFSCSSSRQICSGRGQGDWVGRWVVGWVGAACKHSSCNQAQDHWS